jgi:hypothetical protein
MPNPRANRPSQGAAGQSASGASSTVEELLRAALDRGDDTLQTGRYLVTFRQGASVDQGVQALASQGLRVADARDFAGQAITAEGIGDADAAMLPEIGVALVGGGAAQERGMDAFTEVAADGPVESIDPEYFFFVEGTAAEFLRGLGEQAGGDSGEYLRGFLRAAETIVGDLRAGGTQTLPDPTDEALALGATWGLNACRVPPSVRSGAGIKVAVLDTGMDLRHPDFTGRAVVSETFVGQPVQDLHSHGTHCIGTACGPKAPPGATPRYGIASRSSIHVGKVLSNTGSSVGFSVLAGMNWAIANRCEVISMSLGSQSPPQPAFTNAGQSALDNGLLIVAAAGNLGGATGAPANSPTIMAVASVDPDLRPSAFSNRGKIEISAPGGDVFSSVPRPTRYGVKSGTSMATPHVAGCAALWAQTSPKLRGMALWRQLQTSARRLPFPATRVGAGLVQAP